MKSYYSLIRYVNNPLSRENIAIGLIVISGKDIYYKFSQSKIGLVSKINPDNYKLFEYTLEKIQGFIRKELDHHKSLFHNDLEINQDYLNRLSIYNNGFIQFDKPVAINMDFDDIIFNNFFNKYVELIIKKQQKKIVNRAFRNIIHHVFSEPLKDLIDIDVKIKKEQIPGLYFDYKLDGIGVNNIVYSVKSIDLNSEKAIDIIQKEISEFETLNYRIDRFSQSDLFTNTNNIENSFKNKHYLVIDEYIGNKDSYHKLYEIINEQKKYSFPYEVINTKDLNSVTNEIKNSGIGKFLDNLTVS